MHFGSLGRKKSTSKTSSSCSPQSAKRSISASEGKCQSSKNSSSLSGKVISATSELDSIPNEGVDAFYHYQGRAFLPEVDGKQYFLPCDDEEAERMEVYELVIWHVFQKPFYAPVANELKEGIRVLEIGIGTGKWIMELGAKYPNSQFVGTDIYIYPSSDLPSNCHFQPVDTIKGLPFPDNTFDYVVQRNALYNYTKKEWDEVVVPEMVRVLKPGGWIEFAEGETNIQDAGPKMSTWLMRLNVTLQSRALYSRVGRQLGAFLQSHEQFHNVHSSFRSIPLGWLGKVGDIALEALARLFESLRPKMCEDWDMEPFKYDLLTRSALMECKEFRSWTNYYYCFGQKTANDNSAVTVIKDRHPPSEHNPIFQDINVK